ncbi:YqiA/YcfP family alpha/beta fold hydrolase [Nitratifractor sp.]
MILYIHGFASSGLGAKARAVREYFGDEALAPSLSYVPDLAVDTLEQIVGQARRREEPLGLIGSSLGGYYALWLSQRYELPAVLINPSLRPWETLAAHTGTGTNYYDGARFEWTPEHVESLKKYRCSHQGDRCLLMLQTGDEVLDYRVALEALPEAQTLVVEGGDHSFRGFEEYLPRIGEFLGQ